MSPSSNSRCQISWPIASHSDHSANNAFLKSKIQLHLKLHGEEHTRPFVYPTLLSSGHTLSACVQSIFAHDLTLHMLNNTPPLWHNQSEYHLSMWYTWFGAGTCPICISPPLGGHLTLWAVWSIGSLLMLWPFKSLGLQWVKCWPYEFNMPLSLWGCLTCDSTMLLVKSPCVTTSDKHIL